MSQEDLLENVQLWGQGVCASEATGPACDSRMELPSYKAQIEHMQEGKVLPTRDLVFPGAWSSPPRPQSLLGCKVDRRKEAELHGACVNGLQIEPVQNVKTEAQIWRSRSQVLGSSDVGFEGHQMGVRGSSNGVHW